MRFVPFARGRRRRTGLAAAAVLGLVLAGLATSSPSASATNTKPNVVIVILDDMRLDQIGAMPLTRQLFATGGITFPKAYVSDPLCCPSRASIMTGRYVHNNGVKINDAASSAALDQSTTLQRYLGDAGYSTALVGKYLNGWPLTAPPPHFDRWSVLQTGDTYTNPWFDVDGVRQQLTGHSTDLIGDLSIDVLQDFEQDDEHPFLMFVTPYSPHGPTTPSPGDEDLPIAPWKGNPAVFESNRSDKPPVVRSQTSGFPQAQSLMAQMARSVYGADRMIGRVFAELDRLGETNTIAVFLSDNGLMLGEHGVFADKRLPYEASMRVPFMVRWPGKIPAGRIDQRIVSNVDIAPTVMFAAGITPPVDAPAIDGRNLFLGATRTRAFSESFNGPNMPPWSTIVNATIQYTEWYSPTTGAVTFREYYDLTKDPWRLNNILGDGNPANDPKVPALSALLARDRTCRGTTGATACP